MVVESSDVQDISEPGKPGYLFVVGCARSGTTALGRFLAQHRQVVLGMERYIHRTRPKAFSLSPDLFEYERLSRIEPGDTFYKSTDFAPETFVDLETRLPQARYVGDKIPGLYSAFPQLFKAFGPEMRVVMIFRNVFDVAASWEARRQDADDVDWNRNVTQAVSQWNAALRAYASSAYKNQIIPVLYEDIFSNPAALTGLLEQLGLDADKGDARRAQTVVTKAATLEAGRTRNLGQADLMEIMLKANFAPWRALVSQLGKLDHLTARQTGSAA